MKVLWTRRALQDLEAVFAHLHERDTAAALRTIMAVNTGVSRLAALPLSGRIGRVHRTRELVIPGTRYIVAYRVRPGSVDILAVIHSARRWPKRFEAR